MEDKTSDIFTNRPVDSVYKHAAPGNFGQRVRQDFTVKKQKGRVTTVIW